jgi:hypothetical protein
MHPTIASRFGPALIIVALCLACSVSAQKPPRWHRLYISDPFGRLVLERALDGAAVRLKAAECERLFTFYRDRNGRPLAEKLATFEVTTADYLHLVVFSDAGRGDTCQGEQYAYTTPGSRVVFMCVSRFMRGWRSNPASAEAALIHEVLHTLGLGENPPSSADISFRVQNACSPESRPR